jgi:hypothetical protein
MLDIKGDINPPPSSPVVRLLLQLKESGQPITLSINGKAELPVQDATSFEMLLDLVDRLDCIEAIREGLKELDEGKGLSLEQVKQHARNKYGIPL